MVLPGARCGHGKRTHKTHCRNRDFVLPRQTTRSSPIPSLNTGCCNNTTECGYVIAAVEMALQIPVTNLTIYDDFELIVKQLRKEYSVKKVEPIPYHKREQLLKQFEEVKILHVRRVVKARADALVVLPASLFVLDGEVSYIMIGGRRLLTLLIETLSEPVPEGVRSIGIAIEP